MASRIRKEEVSFDRTDWEEIFYAAESKIKAIEAGFYGYEDPEGDDEEWIEQLKGACDIINSALENHEDVDTSRFSEKDWAEMYYALDSKINGIKSGFFGPEDKRGDNKKWIAHLQRLADEIERYHEV